MKEADTLLSAAVSEPRAATLPQVLASFDLEAAYSKTYRRLKFPFRAALNRHFQSLDLALSLDLLTPREAAQVAELLAALQPTPCVRLWSHSYESQARVFYGLPPSPPLDSEQKEWTKAAKSMEKAALGLNINFSRNATLTQVYLFDLVLTPKACGYLAKGLKRAELIETLGLVACRLNTKCMFYVGLGALLEAICHLDRLRVLVLDRNGFSEGGYYLSRIITFHAQRRDRELWTQSLRSMEAAKPGLVTGLVDLSIAETGLDDKAWLDIGQALEMDNWLKCLNLRGNRLSESSLEALLEVYRRSKGLKVVDIRDIEAGEKVRPALLRAMQRRLAKAHKSTENENIQAKLKAIEENSKILPGFPLQIVMRNTEKRSKPASMSVSFVGSLLGDRKRAKSVEGKRVVRRETQKGTKQANPADCPYCPSLELQLRTALSRISLLEQQLSSPANCSKLTIRSSVQESLIIKAERLIEELTDTVDQLDAKETTATLRQS